jgi:hypothetical protein
MKIGFVYNAPFGQTISEVLMDCGIFLEQMAEITDGATAVPGVGYWKPTDEFEWSIQVYADCPPEKAEQFKLLVASIAMGWAQETEQQSVALIVGDRLQVVPVVPMYQVA